MLRYHALHLAQVYFAGSDELSPSDASPYTTTRACSTLPSSVSMAAGVYTALQGRGEAVSGLASPITTFAILLQFQTYTTSYNAITVERISIAAR